MLSRPRARCIHVVCTQLKYVNVCPSTTYYRDRYYIILLQYVMQHMHGVYIFIMHILLLL